MKTRTQAKLDRVTKREMLAIHKHETDIIVIPWCVAMVTESVIERDKTITNTVCAMKLEYCKTNHSLNITWSQSNSHYGNSCTIFAGITLTVTVHKNQIR